MPETHIVVGRILPERKCFGHEPISLDIKNDPVIGADVRLVFGVIDSQLVARITTDQGRLNDYVIKSLVEQIETVLLNAAAFTTGTVLDVEIVTIATQKEDGTLGVGYQDVVHDVIRDRPCYISVHDIWKLCDGPVGLCVRLCLNDLRSALKYPNDGPFYCYRALEALRHEVARRYDLEERDQQWTRLREIAGLSYDDMETFIKMATALRHGESLRYSGKEWRRIITMTWNAVERFMLHLLEAGGLTRDPPTETKPSS
jgi:hypothetical protein